MWATIIYEVVVLVLTIALAPRPPTPRAAALTDFTLPTAEQGRPIPIIFGTANITGSNCVWYGDLSTSPVTVHSLFSSSTLGYEYFMGIHLVLGHGPFDSINKVYWDQKLCWAGNIFGSTTAPITADGNMCMSALNLFGGERAQGGIQVCFNVIFGGPGEATNPYLTSILGSVPAYRGVTSVVSTNQIVTDNFTLQDYTIQHMTAGCGYIGTSPYIKGVEFECTRIINGWNIAGGTWYPAKAVITHPQSFNSPPTWDPTFSDSTIAAITTPTQNTLQFLNTNPAYTPQTQGFILIGSEWCQFTLQTVDSGGTLLINGFMNLVRGVFGTTATTHLSGAVYEVFDTSVAPTAAMNAAHIIYQILTDPKWGMGLSTALMDDVNFRAGADTFLAENMGLCMQWVNASSCEDFIKIVLNHCSASIVLNNTTGLYQLIPIRGGYNVMTLPSYDEDDILSMDGWASPGWADQVNEVVLVYTDPATRQNTAITGQDLANIDLQGKIVSQTINYQGIRDHLLAQAVLGRELSARCTPLITVKFQINRDAFGVSTGGLFKVSWKARNVVDMVCRITSVNQGTIDNNVINVEAVQDIYSLGLYNYQFASSTPPSVLGAVFTTPSDSTHGPTVNAEQTTPPTSPSDGDQYIVGVGGTGLWAGEDGNVAIWDGSTGKWVFVPIGPGVLVYNQATSSYVTNDGTGLIVPAVIGGGTDMIQIKVFGD